MNRWLAVGAGIVFVSALPRTLHAPTNSTPRITVIVSDEPGTWLLGARLGMEEARRTAGLLRRELRLVETHEGSDPVALLTRDAVSGTAVLIVAESRAWNAIEERAPTHDLVLIDARPTHAGPVSCPEGVFRVGLPLDPDAERTHALWDASLDRHGAAQLNERFRRRFGQRMDEAAWAAWLAVKIATEALLRSDPAEPSALAAWLTSPAATFDGHKGRPLRFDPAHRYLVQPLYATDATGGVREVDWPASPGCAPPERGGAR